MGSDGGWSASLRDDGRRQQKPTPGPRGGYSDGPSRAVTDCGTPLHSYAGSRQGLDVPEGHFSHQDYSFKKALCLSPSNLAKKSSPNARGETNAPMMWETNATKMSVLNDWDKSGLSNSNGDCRIASSDDRREDVLKWHAFNCRRRDEATVKDLLQPGDTDDGDSTWGVIREDRSRDVPHWSAKQYALKKKHHVAHIHKSPDNAAIPDLQTANHLHYSNPATVMKPVESGELGTSHVHNSHAHMCLAKRRHDVQLFHDEACHRSIHPPKSSPDHQFYITPEPRHMAAHLYPEGPSVTARHVPEHFCSNVVYDDESSYAPSRATSAERSRMRPTSPSVDSSRRSKSARGLRGAEFSLWDGSKVAPMSEVYESKCSRGLRSTCSPVTLGYGERYWTRDLPPGSPEEFDSHNTPGKPPPVWTRAPEVGHVYKSHAQMSYDKGLCQAHAYRHCPNWERIEAGSQGHSAAGSDMGSQVGGKARPSARRSDGGGPQSPQSARRNTSSMDPSRRERRSKSNDARRAASTEKVSRTASQHLRSRAAEGEGRSSRRSP